MRRFNINDKVKVKLTPHGRKLLRDAHSNHVAYVRATTGNDCYNMEYTPPREDSNGYSEWQLWELMKTFGEHCYNGCTVPFETTILVDL